MGDQILEEIRKMWLIIAEFIGSSELQEKDQFSKETLEKAAKEFRKFSIQRKSWVKESDIDKYIKNAPSETGPFIRKYFDFKSYFKQGNDYYYNKRQLLLLRDELKERKVDLSQYIRYSFQKKNFNKLIEAAKGNSKLKKKHFTLPDDIWNIPAASKAQPPPVEKVKEHIELLKQDFLQKSYSDYIDIIRDEFAIVKVMYRVEKYIDPRLLKNCEKWVNDFNYANEALDELKKIQNTL